MSIDRLRAHYGFGRMPFAKNLAPGMLHRHAGHAEATARIAWCVTEAAIGVICGEVGAGRTVALRAALAELDTSLIHQVARGYPARSTTSPSKPSSPPTPSHLGAADLDDAGVDQQHRVEPI
jgi:hypothetical protein